jgi:hypothetical protein
MRLAPLPASLLVVVALLGACGGDAPPASEEPTSPLAEREPVVECRGVVGTTCKTIVAEVSTSKPGVPPAAIRITCTAQRCDDREGQVEVDVVFADGSRASHGQGWGTAGPPPVGVPPDQEPGGIDLPVVPVCIRIDRENCRRVAADALMGPDVELPVIRSITVSCPQPCTKTRGEGVVRVRQDGLGEVESHFGYESADGG